MHQSSIMLIIIIQKLSAAFTRLQHILVILLSSHLYTFNVWGRQINGIWAWVNIRCVGFTPLSLSVSSSAQVSPPAAARWASLGHSVSGGSVRTTAWMVERAMSPGGTSLCVAVWQSILGSAAFTVSHAPVRQLQTQQPLSLRDDVSFSFPATTRNWVDSQKKHFEVHRRGNKRMALGISLPQTPHWSLFADKRSPTQN